MPIRVLFTSTTYPRTKDDWRGTFMANISTALARVPELHMMQWSPPGEIAPQITSVSTQEEAEWLSNLMEVGGISHRLRTKPITGLLESGKLLRMLYSVYKRDATIDLYHINWLQCALPLPKNGKPVLISVLGNDLQLLRLPLMKYALRRVMRDRNVMICPNADWMIPTLHDAFGNHAKIQSIKFGIDPRWYNISRNSDALCQPPRWLVVTRLTANKLGPLFEWATPLFSDGQRQLHLFGPMQEQIEIPAWVHYHGAVSPEELAADWFPSAQGLITLSRHAEGRPQVMLEAMAARLPIVASNLPAHADMIISGKTGILCKDTNDFIHAVKILENPEQNIHIGDSACAWVRQVMGTWDDCAGRYIHLYQQLLGRREDE